MPWYGVVLSRRPEKGLGPREYCVHLSERGWWELPKGARDYVRRQTTGCPDSSPSFANQHKRWTLEQHEVNLQMVSECLKLLPHLMRTFSYVFGSERGQVVPMSLHRTADSKVIVQIITFHRLLIHLAIKIWYVQIARGEELIVLEVPHKKRRIGQSVVWDCRSSRKALVVAVKKEEEDEKKKQWLSYSYIGAVFLEILRMAMGLSHAVYHYM